MNSKLQFKDTSKARKMPPSIPDRWIPYKACGKIIEGTRFICFKVPLKRNVQTGVKEIKEIWDITTLLSTIPKLGAVIDLTNTARYYNPKELEAAGILYKKVFVPGRVIPPENTVQQFMNTVDEFLVKDCDLLVGIHCTHGLNRTGYMVCRYMRDRMGIDPKESIRRFQLARGYQIERDNYIADLLGENPPPPQFGPNTNIQECLQKQQHQGRSTTWDVDQGRSTRWDDDQGRSTRWDDNKGRRKRLNDSQERSARWEDNRGRSNGWEDKQERSTRWEDNRGRSNGWEDKQERSTRWEDNRGQSNRWEDKQERSNRWEDNQGRRKTWKGNRGSDDNQGRNTSWDKSYYDRPYDFKYDY